MNPILFYRLIQGCCTSLDGFLEGQKDESKREARRVARAEFYDGLKVLIILAVLVVGVIWVTSLLVSLSPPDKRTLVLVLAIIWAVGALRTAQQ